MNDMTEARKLTPADFASDQEVRWCPGCGDYAILKCMQRTLPELGARPEKTVFVSGIGCSSRFPYYMETYGFHTIHGRAAAVATGLKLSRPDLDVWVITGDGDALSIGGNHTMHALRRNVNLNILLFNNEIYGLTKGQYSPTSRLGTKSPSTPYGSVDRPVSPCAFALGSGGCFVARTIDTAQAHMPGVFRRAYEHKGASFVEIFQNCIVYNDGVWSPFTEKPVAADTQLHLEHGKPMVFGKQKNKGVILNHKTLLLEVVTWEEGGSVPDAVLIHDETNRSIAAMLVDMPFGPFPVAIGVIYCNPAPTFEQVVRSQELDITAKKGAKTRAADVDALLRQGQTWTVS
jgi:2-oxoglutarate/2-oxoacid ferredoxin oxidoreductase subunit beta